MPLAGLVPSGAVLHDREESSVLRLCELQPSLCISRESFLCAPKPLLVRLVG